MFFSSCSYIFISGIIGLRCWEGSHGWLVWQKRSSTLRQFHTVKYCDVLSAATYIADTGVILQIFVVIKCYISNLKCASWYMFKVILKKIFLH